jgi:hypothetical protein
MATSLEAAEPDDNPPVDEVTPHEGPHDPPKVEDDGDKGNPSSGATPLPGGGGDTDTIGIFNTSIQEHDALFLIFYRGYW